MNKRGINIIDKRLKFKTGMQKKFIREIKEKSGLTWWALAKEFNVSQQTMRVDWGEEKTTIPVNIAKLMVKKYPIKKFSEIRSEWVGEILLPKWGQKKGGANPNSHKTAKNIVIPEKSSDLAELFGVILGDGYIGRYELTITSATHEKKYSEYLGGQIKKLFGVESKIFAGYSNNSTVLDCYSTRLVNFLTSEGLAIGNKIAKHASFPQWILENQEYSYAALRGLFDTDGGIYLKQKKYKRAIVEFQTKSRGIRKGILHILKKIGFQTSRSSSVSGGVCTSCNVRIQNQEEVIRFFSLVGSSNPKNIIKFKYFVEKGFVPANKDILREIAEYTGKLPFKAAVV